MRHAWARLFASADQALSIVSIDGRPRRITRRGLELARSQPDNR